MDWLWQASNTTTIIHVSAFALTVLAADVQYGKVGLYGSYRFYPNPTTTLSTQMTAVALVQSLSVYHFEKITISFSKSYCHEAAFAVATSFGCSRQAVVG